MPKKLPTHLGDEPFISVPNRHCLPLRAYLPLKKIRGLLKGEEPAVGHADYLLSRSDFTDVIKNNCWEDKYAIEFDGSSIIESWLPWGYYRKKRMIKQRNLDLIKKPVKTFLDQYVGYALLAKIYKK